jgi:hypothetical protein
VPSSDAGSKCVPWLVARSNFRSMSALGSSQRGGLLPAAKARRTAHVAAGTALLVAGGALLVLPGPGIPLVVAGLAVLGRRYEWPKELGRRAARQLQSLRRR